MKIKNKMLLLTVLAVGFSGAASVSYAACDGNACVGVKVERLYVRNDPTILVSTNGDESQLNCQPTGAGYIELRQSHAKYKEIYSLLLAAKLADHNVWIRVSNTPQSPCFISYVVLE